MDEWIDGWYEILHKNYQPLGKTRNLGGGAKFFDSHCTAVIANGGNSIHGEH